MSTTATSCYPLAMDTPKTQTTDSRPADPAREAFEAPTALEISLCCEISAYAPDGDEMPLF